MKLLNFVDRTAFYVTVTAGTVGALAGAYNWSNTAIAAGCVAAIAPILNRLTAAQEQKARGPRALSMKQRQQLSKMLHGSTFKVWVCHNRHEAEPSKFHAQLFEALKETGLDTQYFGGITNSTDGIEIAGQPSPEKSLLMKAFRAAGIPFQEVVFTDDHGNHWGLSVWIGTNPR
jgi:hypothetical protein